MHLKDNFLLDQSEKTAIQIERINLLKTTLRFVKWTCVYGAANRSDDRERTGNFVGEIVNQLKSEILDCSYQERHLYAANAVLRYRAGNCEDQVSLAILFLLSRDEKNLHEFSIRGRYHTLLAVGLNQDSNLLIPESIPDNAFILDPWNNMLYPAKEFATRSRQDDADKLFINGEPCLNYSFQKEGLKSVLFNIDSTDTPENFSQQLQEFLTDPMHYKEKERSVTPYLFLQEFRVKSKLDTPSEFLVQLNDKKDQRLSIYLNHRFFHTHRAGILDTFEVWAHKIFRDLLFNLDTDKDYLNKFDPKGFGLPTLKQNLDLLSDASIDKTLGKIVQSYYCYKRGIKWKSLCLKFSEQIQNILQRTIQFSSWQDGKFPYNVLKRDLRTL